MVIARSPRYPLIGLREATEKARAAWENEHQNKIAKEVVAQHMGYRTLNGKSLGIVSAVLKYGLIDGRADRMWVTDRAVAIFAHELGDPERVAAIKEAAAEPELFRELDSTFKGKISDQSLRAYLITKRKFLPEAADRAIRSYRETRELVEAETEGYNGEQSGEEVSPMQSAAEDGAKALVPIPLALPARGSEVRENLPPLGSRKAVFALAEGDVVIHFPEGLSPDSVEDLAGYLNIFMKRARREATPRLLAQSTDSGAEHETGKVDEAENNEERPMRRQVKSKHWDEVTGSLTPHGD